QPSSRDRHVRRCAGRSRLMPRDAWSPTGEENRQLRQPPRVSMRAFRVIACAVAALSALQGPSNAELAIARYIDTHNAQALALLERVVNLNSGTQNLSGVREVGRIFRDELDALG